MDQMPVMPALGTPAVPHGAILSYVTNVSTPTRVRLVASRAVLFAGVVEALAALFLLLGLALIVPVLIRHWQARHSDEAQPA